MLFRSGNAKVDHFGPDGGLGLGLGFDVDGGLVGLGGIGHVARGRRGLVVGSGRAVLHAVLEALDGAAEVGAVALMAIARRHGIPVVEEPELCGALCELPLDEQIPSSLFEAAAIVLAKIRVVGDRRRLP